MDIRVGKVTHYYDHISVAVLELTGELKVGDTIHILAHHRLWPTGWLDGDRAPADPIGWTRDGSGD
jgi:hypothetical protein